MATRDNKKREANVANAQARRPALGADQMLLYINKAWKALGFPESEKPSAMRHGMEKLYLWLVEHIQEIDRIRAALQVQPISAEVKEDIVRCRDAAKGGDDPDPSTPLDLARRHGIPLVAVLYVADGEPTPDTAVESPSRTGPIYTRPWRSI